MTSFSDMAETYINAVQRVFPEGPYTDSLSNIGLFRPYSGFSNRSNRLKSGFTENTVFDSELV